MLMSNIYTPVGLNGVLRHSNSNNEIVIGDFNAFRFFWDTLYADDNVVFIRISNYNIMDLFAVYWHH